MTTHYDSLQLMTTHSLCVIFPAFSCLHVLFLPFLLHVDFSFFISFFISLSLFPCAPPNARLLCTLILNAPLLYTSIMSSLISSLLCISSTLRIFLNIASKMPIQQAPNTHPWLVLSHSGLLCHSLP
jgi:hypothetical protein